MQVVMDFDALPRPVAFVLGGGGSLGASQVGMLQALVEVRLAPDLVVGTSVGSINGAMLALDPGGAAHRLGHIWTRMSRAQVFPGGVVTRARTLRRQRTHLFQNTGLAELIDSFLGADATFADLMLPFAAVAMDIATGAPYPITSGSLRTALLASAAIPGIYPAVDHDGRSLYDGGLVANVPLRQAVDRGARSLVVLDCNFPGQMPPVPRTMSEVLEYVVVVAGRTQAALEAPTVAREVPVVYLPGPPLRRLSPLDFKHTPDLIEGAYQSTRAFLAGLAVDGPGLYGSPSS
jgi:NTE family protein